MNIDGNFTKVKRFITFIVGVAVLWASIIFSKNGFEFKTSAEYVWVGWVLAFAATSAQFMMNSSFKKINWTIILIGSVSYIYSIWTNMEGFHSLRSTESVWNVLNVGGSLFMDIFPEVGIAWALDESKVGDFVGNLVKMFKYPEQVTSSNNQTQPIKTVPDQQHNPFNGIPRAQEGQKPYVPGNIPNVPDFMRKHQQGGGKRYK